MGHGHDVDVLLGVECVSEYRRWTSIASPIIMKSQTRILTDGDVRKMKIPRGTPNWDQFTFSTQICATNLLLTEHSGHMWTLGPPFALVSSEQAIHVDILPRVV